MKVQLIDTGRFYADGGAMFGAIPKTAWSRRYPCNEKNGCILTMRSMLVETDSGRIILIDNGAGDKHLKQLAYYGFFDLVDLEEELLKRGIRAEDVTDMVFTHLHFDHCGYTTRKESTGGYTLAFPHARHWVSRTQWNNFLSPNALERESYFIENMQAVEEAGLLQLIDKETRICPEVNLRLADGHTPGQIVPYVETPDRDYIFAGDVIPLIASLSPEWISAYDTYPVCSYQEKVKLLDEAAAHHQAIVYCHDAYHACSTVKKIKDFYVKEKLIAL